MSEFETFEMDTTQLEKSVNGVLAFLFETRELQPAAALFVLQTATEHLERLYGMKIERALMNVEPGPASEN